MIRIILVACFERRKEIFGDLPDSPRFPLLIKLLDAHDQLSLQVHPPAKIAAKLGGEPKTEFWYVASAIPGAVAFVDASQVPGGLKVLKINGLLPRDPGYPLH